MKQIARVMSGCVSRPADLAARYGGEESICILPETDSSSAVALAEEIRRYVLENDLVEAIIGLPSVLVQGTKPRKRAAVRKRCHSSAMTCRYR